MVPIIIIRDKVYVMREMLIHHCHHKFELMFNPPPPKLSRLLALLFPPLFVQW